MLASVLTRRTTDAILACYAAIVVSYFTAQILLVSVRLPAWVDPLQVLADLLAPLPAPRTLPVLLHLALWVGVGAACVALAVRWLRPAALGQAEQRPGRWLWAFRRRVGDDPVCWRERYVIGLAPLPVLRMVPTWMGRTGVLVFSAIVAATGVDWATGRSFFPTLRSGDLPALRRLLHGVDSNRLASEVTTMGVILIVLGVAVVGVRCAGSISEEKRRKTWEDLVLTPLSMEEIVSGKRRGVLGAVIPYLAAYALPMFALGALAGRSSVTAAAVWVAVAGVLMVAAAWVGMEVSAGSEDREPDPDLPLYHRPPPRSGDWAERVRGWGAERPLDEGPVKPS
jgi:hypothetical protein